MTRIVSSRLDWYAWFPKDVQSSRNYQRMSPEQRGSYHDLLDECWINAEKGCGIRVDKEWAAMSWGVQGPEDDEPGKIGWREEGLRTEEPLLAHITNCPRGEWQRVMPAVLRMFRMQGGLLVNDRLLTELDNALQISANAKIRRLGKGEPEPTPDSLQSNSSPTTVPPQSDNTVPNITEHNRHNSTALPSSSELDELLKGGGENTSTRPKGTPGYFARGQYPGTSPKAIFSHVAKAWTRIRGAAAVCRYPSKYPANWELLCDAHSADLLVPAFELWALKNGYNTEWPLTEFIKVAQEYMAQVIPLKENKPALTDEVIKRSNEVANARHEAVWANDSVPQKAADINEF